MEIWKKIKEEEKKKKENKKRQKKKRKGFFFNLTRAGKIVSKYFLELGQEKMAENVGEDSKGKQKREKKLTVKVQKWKKGIRKSLGSNRERPEGSYFNSYYTKVFGKSLLLSM